MGVFKLSSAAAEDLDRLYVRGVMEFGLAQADRYYDGLATRFRQIADAPFMYPDVSYIRPGYRRSVYGVHSIYYRIDDASVFIVRIINKQAVSDI